MEKNGLVLILLIASFGLQAQQNDTVFFKSNYSSMGNNGPEPVYKYISDSIYYRNKPYKIVIPKNLDTADLAFCFTYFTGWENMPIQLNSPMLISGYKNFAPKIYIDKNQNLDFTDDGAPVLLKGLNDSVTITYSNSKNELAFFSVSIKFIRYHDDEHKKMIVTFFSNNQNGTGNTLVDSKYWLSNSRLNNRVITGTLFGEKVKIGIKDQDCNGFNNDKKHDLVMVGNYSNGFISDRISKGAYTFEDTTLVKINHRFFRVIDIEPTGKYIVLSKTNLTSTKIETGEVFPNLKIRLMDTSTVFINDLLDEKKYTLIDIWGTWCTGCRYQTKGLKRLDSIYNSSLKIISLDFGDPKGKGEEYIKENNIKWSNGFSTAEINKKFLVDSYPYLILMNEKKEIILMQTNLSEVESILNNIKLRIKD